MRGHYGPMPRWLSDTDVLSLIVVPVWIVLALVIRRLLRLPKPPRAMFEISHDQVKAKFCDSAGQTMLFRWPRSAVAELRANRFQAGLWISVPGHVKDTFLEDLPLKTVEHLEDELRKALSFP
jgi:hypothetical protein